MVNYCLSTWFLVSSCKVVFVACSLICDACSEKLNPGKLLFTAGVKRHHVVGTVLSVVMVMSHYSIYCCGLSLRSVLYINSLISIVFGACFLLVSPQFCV